MAPTVDRETTVQALDDCFASVERLMADLSADEWSVQSLCPEWDVRGVVTHLAGIEAVLTGWAPASAEDPPPFERMGEFASEVAGASNADLAAKVGTIFENRREELAAMTDADFARPAFMPTGPGTYGRFMNIRVFDFWVHERDIAIPLGRPTSDGGPAGEIALDEVHSSLGYIVGKKIGLPDPLGIAFRLTGGVPRDLYAKVDGRAAVVDDLADPDVEVSTDSTTFIMLACGRIDPRGQIDSGAITWSGDDTWGERAASNLRFTM